MNEPEEITQPDSAPPQPESAAPQPEPAPPQPESAAPQPASTADASERDRSLDKAFLMMLRWTPQMFLLIIIAIIGVGAFKASSSPEPILKQLSDIATARGLITLLFSVGTIWIALLLCVAALSGFGDQDRFNRGKEILALLIGIFGTIVGYYFGSQNQPELQAPPQGGSNGKRTDITTTHYNSGCSQCRKR